MSMTRRTALFSIAALPLASSLPRVEIQNATAALRRLEEASGGRLGVAIQDLESGGRATLRPDERFPMCSTFKLLAAAAVLARVDQGSEDLVRRIRFTKADLLEYAPVTRARVAEGSMTLGDLCEAAMTASDNTAANLILATLGGPAGVTAFARSLGDAVTRLDRKEPELNESRAGDPRDTTTPAAMVGNLRRLLIEDALSNKSRATLVAWLAANKTGAARLRAGVPPDWRVGDKTGTGNGGSTNDIGILWPPHRRPVLVAAYLTESAATPAVREVSDMAQRKCPSAGPRY
jgi:beta-lactamase class A